MLTIGMPVTLVRLDKAIADILLPGETTTLRDFAERLRAASVFPDEDADLARLAAWPVVPPPRPDWLERGSLDVAVWALQAALLRLAELENIPALSPEAADADYGPKTEAAVRAFQEWRKIEVDGVAGPETLGALEEALAARGVHGIVRGVARAQVGILLSHPRKLVPGADEEVTRLARKVLEMGCRPVLIPPCVDVLFEGDGDARAQAIRGMVEVLDGVLGPGGGDVDPAIYGEPDEFAENTNLRRDRFEADLALCAMEQPLFMFGICRSHQLWNAAAGGSLVQDVEKEGLSGDQRQGDYSIPGDQPFVVRADDGRVLFENRVELKSESLAAEVIDRAPSLLTNSFHHEAVDVPGKGFDVVGTVYDPRTGKRTIEMTERWNAFTTQFHPEGMLNDPLQRELFETLGRRARIFRMVKAGQRNKAALAVAMRQYPAALFDASDYEWVEQELSAHLILT
jgi:gamma-glutamyl-gamma-aminobutyrate hydrolase PuuD/peptidoglycan hydrolase-like protein with peptidoglycan-binding domain